MPDQEREYEMRGSVTYSVRITVRAYSAEQAEDIAATGKWDDMIREEIIDWDVDSAEEQ